MYKCTDCGQEYKIKPEYCDCGNNIFEEIQEVIKPKEAIYHSQRANKPSKRVEKNLSGEILSWLIFTICIILSALALMFLGNSSTPTKTEVNSKPKVSVKKNIPSIDELWVEPNIDVKPQEEEKPSILQSIFDAPVVQRIKNRQNQQSIKTERKITPTPQPAPPVQQVVTPPQPRGEQIKNPPSQAPKEPELKQIPPKIDEAALRREYTKYKIALRNTIAANIDFAGIIGDGKCAVTFKIDQAGNLINRKFAIQSNNNSLNDVVYNAMMQNPTFQQPPKGYKNETLTLSVKMYDGNFEVTLN